MLRGSVTASLIGYVLLMHVKEFGQLLIYWNILAAGENWQRFVLRKNEVVIPLYSRVNYLVNFQVRRMVRLYGMPASKSY